MQGWGGSHRGGVGWSVSCISGVGHVGVGGVGHVGVGLCHVGVGWGGVGHVGVDGVGQGGSCRGGVE